MTRQEFYDKYGNVKVKFSRFYKFMFTFNALLPDGSVLVCNVGGNSDDIYRLEVTVDSEETLKSLGPFSGSVYKDYKEVESFYDCDC